MITSLRTFDWQAWLGLMIVSLVVLLIAMVAVEPLSGDLRLRAVAVLLILITVAALFVFVAPRLKRHRWVPEEGPGETACRYAANLAKTERPCCRLEGWSPTCMAGGEWIARCGNHGCGFSVMAHLTHKPAFLGEHTCPNRKT